MLCALFCLLAITAQAVSSERPAPPGSAAADAALLATQAGRVSEAVAALAAERPGTTDVFFIGFAGYGEQRVCRKEAIYAREVIGKRYGSAPRSILLINDIRDRESFPLATVTNLRLALRLVGERMNRDEDVLVLFLTSHGDPKTGLEVSNGDLPLMQLQPKPLRRALDASGVRWRIVLASACYAGIFLKPLQGETTLVLTAADARHGSFGCEDERELTYFGEALLRDALPTAASLEQAFAEAAEAIRRREAAEKLEHSRPQIFVGAAMRTKLAELENGR
jgi:hypothetical protein